MKAGKGRNFAVIINPSSGQGRAKKLIPALRSELDYSGIAYTFFESQNEGQFRQLIRDAHKPGNRFSALAIGGGDSSFAIATGELLSLKEKALPLAMIGMGSSDDLVREFGHSDLKSAVSVMASGTIRAANLIMIYDGKEQVSPYLGQASIGIGYFVNRFVESWKKKGLPATGLWQTFAGLIAICHTIIRKKTPLQISLVRSGRKQILSAHIVMISQIRYWASGLIFAPGASPFATMKLVIVENMSLLRFLKVAWKSRDGRHTELSGVVLKDQMDVKIASETPFAIQMDGEPIRTPTGEIRGFTSVSFKQIRKKLRIFFAD